MIMFDIILTENCNFNCSYCYQRRDSIPDESFISKSSLELALNCFKKLKDIGSDRININIMGGELSTFPKETLEYFKIILNYTIRYLDITRVYFTFSTNFSGDILFFKEVHLLFKDYNYCTDISIHLEYNNILNISNKIKEFRKFYKNINIEVLTNSNYTDLPLELKNIKGIKPVTISTLERYVKTPIKVCTPNYFEIRPTGEILNKCTKDIFNFLNFKLAKEIECDHVCPCIDYVKYTSPKK